MSPFLWLKLIRSRGMIPGSNPGRAPEFTTFLSFGQQCLIIILSTMFYGFIKY